MNILKGCISKQASESLEEKYKRIVVTIFSFSIILALQIIDNSINIYSVFIIVMMLVFLKNEIEKMIIVDKMHKM